MVNLLSVGWGGEFSEGTYGVSGLRVLEDPGVVVFGVEHDRPDRPQSVGVVIALRVGNMTLEVVVINGAGNL
jgi:hypothetical protein